MGFSILPTNIGGVSLSSIGGPLASLLAPTNQIQNLVFPSDLGSNPAMGHAVIISAHDYTSKLGDDLKGLINKTISDVTNSDVSKFETLFNFGKTTLETLGEATQAANYAPVEQKTPLATVSLFMPETVNMSYNSSYSEVSITEELGLAGFAGNAFSDASKFGLKGAVTPYGIAAGAKALNKASQALGGTGQIGNLAAQGAGVFVNPQMQLLYRGIGLRTFQLEFTLTPKSAAEAKVAKDICDTLTFYSLPGISGSQVGGSGQFLTPPQIFKVQFKFLGQNSITGKLSSIINSALTTSGLGFLTQSANPSGVISSAAAAKTYTVGNCVLEDVSVDYAPNGWAAYNDGYPVQTRLTLQFKETTMITKDAIKNQAVQDNYNNAQTAQIYGTNNGSEQTAMLNAQDAEFR
jgi:hypothetical protein